MPNIKSAKKAARQSIKKNQRNLFWKRRIRSAIRTLKKTLGTKNVDIDILKKEEANLQKMLDKAAKNKVIHKNKAARIKGKYAKRIAAHQQKTKSTNKKAAKS